MVNLSRKHLMLGLGCLSLLSVTAAGQDETSDEIPLRVRGSAENVQVIVRSNPDGGRIQQGTRVVGVTPDTLIFKPGTRELQVVLEGYQPLHHRFEVKSGADFELEFVLLPTPPEPALPEDWNEEYWPEAPLRSEREAAVLKVKYDSMSELFLVFPTAQGLIGMLAFKNDRSFPAQEMFLTGAALVVVSRVAGRFFSSRKLAGIIADNTMIKGSNAAAESHNADLDALISSRHAANVIDWQRTSEGRGVVNEIR